MDLGGLISDLFDTPLSEKQKKRLEWFEAFLLIFLLNIVSKLLASAITLCTRGVYDMLSGATYTNSEMRLDITYALTFPINLALVFFSIVIRRTRFQWDENVDTWKPVRLGFFLRHLTAYAVYSLITDIYYAVVGVYNVYHPTKFVPGMKIDMATMTEPWWIANFLAPQAALFRVTRHLEPYSLALGIVVNIVLFTVVLYWACFRKTKKERLMETNAEDENNS
ncbi:MAG: hypothetical protein ACOX4O_00060 [Eubacteriales bacterium]|jgi:hypothetical protein